MTKMRKFTSNTRSTTSTGSRCSTSSAMISRRTMDSIERLWAVAAEDGPGGAVRISAEDPADLFAATDSVGRRGLLLITAEEPPARPSLDAVEVTCGRRHDGRWALGVWLT